VRDADDSNIDVQSPRAGQRLLASMTRCLERRLQLTVNAAKSTRTRGVSLQRVVDGLRQYLDGWYAYVRCTEGQSSFKDLDPWVRRRLRCDGWKQWGPTAVPGMAAPWRASRPRLEYVQVGPQAVAFEPQPGAGDRVPRTLL
jgi:RNA-directed DNA polymerase